MSVALLTGTRFFVAFGAAGATIYYLNKTLFPKKSDPKPPKRSDSSPTPDTDVDAAPHAPAQDAPIVATAKVDDHDRVKYVVALNSTIFTLIGLAVAVTAARRWEVALLLCGTCLLGGGFLGLLFGYPQGAAQQTTTQTVSATADPQPAQPAAVAAAGGAAPAPPAVAVAAPAVAAVPPAASTAPTTQVTAKTNLVAESAATLGKVITGFTLADARPIYNEFRHISHAVSPALSCGSADCNPDTNHILAAVMILYFLATGFLSGLFLPSYFMKGDI